MHWFACGPTTTPRGLSGRPARPAGRRPIWLGGPRRRCSRAMVRRAEGIVADQGLRHSSAGACRSPRRRCAGGSSSSTNQDHHLSTSLAMEDKLRISVLHGLDLRRRANGPKAIRKLSVVPEQVATFSPFTPVETSSWSCRLQTSACRSVEDVKVLSVKAEGQFSPESPAFLGADTHCQLATFQKADGQSV